MDLWIRSQDKERLGKINDIRLNMLNDKEIIGNYIQVSIIKNDYEKLGIYNTKERALEVLDEISEKICLLQSIELAKGNDITLVGFKNAIGEEKLKGLCFPYEMPKE